MRMPIAGAVPMCGTPTQRRAPGILPIEKWILGTHGETPKLPSASFSTDRELIKGTCGENASRFWKRSGKNARASRRRGEKFGRVDPAARDWWGNAGISRARRALFTISAHPVPTPTSLISIIPAREIRMRTVRYSRFVGSSLLGAFASHVARTLLTLINIRR